MNSDLLIILIAFSAFSMYYRSFLYFLLLMSQCAYAILKYKDTYLITLLFAFAILLIMLPNDWQAICLFSPSYHIVDKKITVVITAEITSMLCILSASYLSPVTG